MSQSNIVDIKITAENMASPAFQSAISEMKGLGSASTAVTAEVQKTAAASGSAGTAASSASGGFLKLGSSVGSMVTGLSVGGFAATQIVGKLMGMAKAAAEDQASVMRLEQAVNNAADGGWKAYAASINDVIKQGQNLAFTDDDTRGALAFLEAQTGNTADALHRLSVAEDLARGANIDLATASRLLGKISDDSVSALTRLGVRLGANVTAQEALNAVDAKFGGQAGAFAASSAGKMAILHDRVGELEESLGYKLLPTVINTTTELTKLIDLFSGSNSLPTTVTQGGYSLNVIYSSESQSNASKIKDFIGFAEKFIAPGSSEGRKIVVQVATGVAEGALNSNDPKDVQAYADAMNVLYSRIYQINSDGPGGLPPLSANLAKLSDAEFLAAVYMDKNIAKAKAQADQLKELDHAYTKVGQTLEQQHGVGRGGGMGESDEVRAASESWKAYGAATADAAAQVILTDNAVNKLLGSQNLLSAAYQVGLHDQAAFTGQASEYGGEIDNIQKGLDVWKRRLDDGSISQEEYDKHLDAGTRAIGRYKGGQDDAITTAADYAIANETLMEAQDKIHQQYPDLIAGSEAYTQKLKDAFVAAGGTADQFDQLNSDSGGLNAAIGGPGGLTEAVLALIQALKDSDIHPKPSVEVTFKGDERLFGIKAALEALDGQSYASQYTLDIGFTGGAGLPGVPSITYNGGSANDNTGSNAGTYGAPPDDSGRGPQRTIQSYTPKDTLPPLLPVPADAVRQAQDAAGNAQSYEEFIKQLVQSLADAAASMGDGVDSAKSYADLAKTALDVMSAAIDLNVAMGDKQFQYGDWQARNIQALTQIAEKSTQSLSDAAALADGPQLDATKKYADAASASLGVMNDALGFSVAMGDTVVLYGDWQARNIANLKQIAEKSTVSIGESAATMDGPFLDGIQKYADAASAALSVESDTLKFLSDLSDAGDVAHMDTHEIARKAQVLAADARLVADAVGQAAQGWDTSVTPAMTDLNTAVGASTGALSSTLQLLDALSAATDPVNITGREMVRKVGILASDALLLAQAFRAQAGYWTTDVTPAMQDLETAVGASTGAFSNTLDLLAKLNALGDGQLAPSNLAALAQELAADSVLFVRDLQTASANMDVDGVTAAGVFADGAGKVVNLMGSAADAMNKIATVSEISQQQAGIFSGNMHIVFDLIRQLNTDVQPYAADAAAFKDVIEIIAADMQAAASAIQTLAPGGNAASGLSGTAAAYGGRGGGTGSGVSSNPQTQTYQVAGTGGGYLAPIQVYLDTEPVAVRVMGNMARQVPHPVVRSG